MTEYRKHGGRFHDWHLHSDCPEWPETNYIRQTDRPTNSRICARCLELESYVMAKYRKLSGSLKEWHFHRDCPEWPEGDYVEHKERPVEGTICARCLMFSRRTP